MLKNHDQFTAIYQDSFIKPVLKIHGAIVLQHVLMVIFAFNEPPFDYF